MCVLVLCLFFFKQKTAYEMLRSLVGSEMCIRDRLGGAGPQGDEGDAAGVELAELGLGGDFAVHDEQLRVVAGHGVPAVSYTHLRAHETPEHLVCRLLLEKKKKKINNK